MVEVGAALRAENRSLQELRDTLLPKLMSGEIRLRDAEKVIEDVT
jgi:type I restriction enzyme, S subunit